MWTKPSASRHSGPEGRDALALCDVVFINLSHREDRRHQITGELERVGFDQFRRFDAIMADPGGLGCALSHLAVLNSWGRIPDRLLLIAEDDCQFLLPTDRINDLIAEFHRSTGDVLSLAYSAYDLAPIEGEPLFRRAFDTQTMACYLVKPHMVDPLIGIARKSIDLFHAGRPYQEAAIDRVWKELQSTATFFVPVDRAARQRPSYSDIEQRMVDYNV
jgi:glycosyl transferase family 25